MFSSSLYSSFTASAVFKSQPLDISLLCLFTIFMVDFLFKFSMFYTIVCVYLCVFFFSPSAHKGTCIFENIKPMIFSFHLLLLDGVLGLWRAVTDSGLMGEVLCSLQTELLTTLKRVELCNETANLQETGSVKRS